MEKKLYLECNSGIAGDMMAAALIDLGADQERLKAVLDSIPADGYQVAITRVKKAGVDCCDFHVILDHDHENHDHDMEYLYGADHGHEHHEHHDHHHEHDHHEHDHHDHGHHHGYEHHHHEHRGIVEVKEILQKTEMTDSARMLAERIFDILAEAEAKAHAVPIEEVHFHEVGAIDSIVDIVAVAVCLDDLGIQEVIVPKLCEGTGTVRCQHGILPVPVPAVANILQSYHIPVKILPVQGEFVTPTGAAIVAAIQTDEELPEVFSIERIGMGAGKRTYERPSILRAMLIGTSSEEKVWKIETDIDDCTGEELGYVMDRLFEAGAKDVHYTPVYMKKNRPAWQMNVICLKEDVERLEEMILRETTTIGVRSFGVERMTLKREMISVETPYGMVDVKKCYIGEGVRYYPEYDSVAAICKREDLPYRQVYQLVSRCCDVLYSGE